MSAPPQACKSATGLTLLFSDSDTMLNCFSFLACASFSSGYFDLLAGAREESVTALFQSHVLYHTQILGVRPVRKQSQGVEVLVMLRPFKLSQHNGAWSQTPQQHIVITKSYRLNVGHFEQITDHEDLLVVQHLGDQVHCSRALCRLGKHNKLLKFPVHYY